MVGGNVMELRKYADRGFNITKFGTGSKVLRFNQKPIFVFNAKESLDYELLTRICESYLKICGKRKNNPETVAGPVFG